MLAPQAFIRHPGGQRVELPLRHVERVERRLIGMGEKREDVDVGLAAWVIILAIRLFVPAARLGHQEGDLRQPLLMPALDVGSRLDLHSSAVAGLEVVGRPLLADAAIRNPESAGNEVLREYTPRGVADHVGGTPLPEAQEIETQSATAVVKQLVAATAFAVDRPQVAHVCSSHHRRATPSPAMVSHGPPGIH